MAKLFDFEAVLSQLPEILKYLPTTLILAVSSMILCTYHRNAPGIDQNKKYSCVKTDRRSVYLADPGNTSDRAVVYCILWNPDDHKIHIPAKWMELSEFDNLRFCVCDHRTFYQ